MGHYRVGEFEAPAQEVSRLADQARVIAVKERAALTDVGLPTTGRGIEVGCGPGFFAGELARESPGLALCGLDYDPFVLNEARSRLPVVRGDANALPFAPGSFDFAYSRLFLRHVSDPLAVLRGIAALVRPGGAVAAIDSSDVSLLLDPTPADFLGIAAARRAWFDRRHGTADMGHQLHGLFVRAGLRDVRVRTVVLDSATVGRAAFCQIVITAFLQAAESVLNDQPRMAAANAAIAAWRDDPAAYGAITLFVVGAVNP
jgi:SAM-dependent methyltransferase